MIDTALQFSGGKDSLACLYLYQQEWDEILVCWTNTGAAYPETVEYMRKWAERLPHFLEIKTNQPEQIARNGYPTEVVPLNYTPIGRSIVKGAEAFRVQPHFACCSENIWLPMHTEMKRRGIKRIIRGQRRDERRTAPIENGHVDADGIEYVFPLEDWTEQQVFAYLEEVGAEIPPYYATEKTSRDCWDCTAYLDENIERIRNLPDEKRAEVKRRLGVIEAAVESELKLLREIRNAC